MTDRDGIVDRRAVEAGAVDVSRWLKDTLRMWPIILLVGVAALRSESTRNEVARIQDDFVQWGPRVSTEKDRPTTIEAELRSFRSELRLEFMPREVLNLKLDAILAGDRFMAESLAELHSKIDALESDLK
jgi:hypothetical protein